MDEEKKEGDNMALNQKDLKNIPASRKQVVKAAQSVMSKYKKTFNKLSKN